MIASSRSIEKLHIFLIKNEFRRFTPVCRTWNSVFALKKNSSALCILIRKNGIDIRLYSPYISGLYITKNEKIRMRGGRLYRNHYNQSGSLMIEKVRSIAESFVMGVIEWDEIQKEDGRSYLLNPEYRKIKSKSRHKFELKRIKLKSSKID